MTTSPRPALFAAALACTACAAVAQHGVAAYRVTYHSSWSPVTHPTAFPSHPHYSPLVGATHDGSVTVWEPGGIATPGLEQVAEVGYATTLAQELAQHVQAGAAAQVLNYGFAGALGASPGSVSVTFVTPPDSAQLSLVSMLAPSPDWFVGLHGVELMHGGDWVESLTVPAHGYDAGTDSGGSYLSPDADVTPHLPIARVTTLSGPFASASTQVGTFTIQRLHSTRVYGCANPAGSLSVFGAARLGQSLQLTLADPTLLFPTPAVTALALSTTRSTGAPCGPLLPGRGMVAGQPGELLIGAVDATLLGPLFLGGTTTVAVPIPPHAALVGQSCYLQGLLAGGRTGLTRAVAVRVGS